MSEGSIQAVIVDPAAPERFVIRDVAAPQPLPNQALVVVKRFSVNRGEVRRAMTVTAQRPIGWDFAGVVEKPAADGSGPPAGARVAGMLDNGAWAQKIAAPVNAIAQIPDDVSFSVAASLPVAGLTALHSLYKGGFLLGKNVLVTGATGGTGDFACQLALLAGANVTATVRSPNRQAFVHQLGVRNIVVGEDPSAAANFGPFALIIDSVGGPHFDKILAMLATRGVCVIFGTSGGNEPTINASKFYSTGPTTLYGFILFNELKIEPASIGLKILADLVSSKKLVPHIDLEQSWTDIAKITKRLMDRAFTGKAVMAIE
jgi:NADPH:quinone reductase-like Zn-dependent oxidoreductase